MNIAEMHVWFRQYAQQMGMQNVRAILPEQIDVAINTSISDVVNQLVRQNVGVKNGRVISDVAKLNQINALHSLYKVKELDLAIISPFMEFLANNVRTGKMNNKNAGLDVGQTISTIISPDSILYLVDFKLNYKVTSTGYIGLPVSDLSYVAPVFSNNAIETEYFPVRFVDEAYLAETTTDYVLRTQLRSPIIVTYDTDNYELYVGKFRENVIVDDTDPDNPISTTYYVLDNNLVPYKLRMSYIAKPAEVRYVTDYNPALDNIDCDLPESMHTDILKHAVDLYMISIRGGLYNSQQPQQAASNETQPTGGYQN